MWVRRRSTVHFNSVGIYGNIGLGRRGYASSRFAWCKNCQKYVFVAVECVCLPDSRTCRSPRILRRENIRPRVGLFPTRYTLWPHHSAFLSSYSGHSVRRRNCWLAGSSFLPRCTSRCRRSRVRPTEPTAIPGCAYASRGRRDDCCRRRRVSGRYLSLGAGMTGRS